MHRLCSTPAATMESLMQVMAAKKRELSTIKAEKANKKEKYMRRGDVEEILYAQQQQQQQIEESNKKRRLEDHKTNATATDAAHRSELKDSAVQQLQQEDAMIPLADLRRRLRELDQPITLFGESARDCMERLRRAENDAAARREDGLSDGHDTRNEFMGSSRQDADKDDDDDDGPRQAQTNSREAKASVDDDGSADDEQQDDVTMVYRFFKGMLRRWEQDLADRPDHIRRTAQGKMATKTMKQCKDYIRPLFKLCKKHEVPSDILPCLADIVRFCKDGEFVQANDAYIKLAICNAAWPIGVTMVGIHERTGREKINANKQAHVMNNEAQRKYITSVKRLISYAQSVSSVLPSKKVS